LLPRAASITIVFLLCTACAHGASRSSPRSAAPVVRVSERQNDKTVALDKGQRLQVVLHSTYWQIHGSSDPTVLATTGRPRTRPRLSGCVPGGGCGTVTAVYLATGAGTANVTASRTSCGEALGCTAAGSRYTLNVRVGKS
jgi:hypothetical protein